MRVVTSAVPSSLVIVAFLFVFAFDVVIVVFFVVVITVAFVVISFSRPRVTSDEVKTSLLLLPFSLSVRAWV